MNSREIMLRKQIANTFIMCLLGIEITDVRETINNERAVIKFTIPKKLELTSNEIKGAIHINKFVLDYTCITDNDIDAIDIDSDNKTSEGLAKIAKKLILYTLYEDIKDTCINNFNKELSIDDEYIMTFMSRLYKCIYHVRPELWDVCKSKSEINKFMREISAA